MALTHIIETARGEREADLILTNARIVNVYTGEIQSGNVAVVDGHTVGWGDFKAKQKRDLGGRYLAPGFIDAHVHIESAMTAISEFGRAILARGTTSIVADPHEIANVLGTQGLDYMLASAEGQPLNVFFALPSCVPATDMETAGARLTADDLRPYLSKERVVALGEMMNFPGVIFADPEVLAKIAASRRQRKPVDGHAPGLSGGELMAYLAAGIGSDHECTTAQEAAEKLAAGMHIMVREGTCARNLDALRPLINARTAPRMMWCSDDRHPHDLLAEGHIDAIVRKAIGAGIDPVVAIQMATLSPATYFRLTDVGAIAPGKRADFVVFSDLHDPITEAVYSKGQCVAEDGQMLPGVESPPILTPPPTMNLDPAAINFTIPAEGKRIRVIDLVPDQVVTGQVVMEARVMDQMALSDPRRDILKIAVVERHHNSGAMARGFIRGLGLTRGALASSVAHDSHNIIVVGVADQDMHRAVEAVVAMGGGFAAAEDGKVTATVPLPIAGLMSDQPVAVVRDQMDVIIQVAQRMGSRLADPFMALGFAALPVIPELKITDKGLVDVNRFEIVPLFVDE
jgi:adenine deaminase